MTYAVIEICGKQLKVEPGRFYDIDRINQESETEVSIDKVLLVSHDNDIHVGQPYVESATVSGTIIDHRRGKSFGLQNEAQKENSQKRGHRQELTRLMIDSIRIGGNVIAEKTSESKSVETEVAIEA